MEKRALSRYNNRSRYWRHFPAGHFDMLLAVLKRDDRNVVEKEVERLGNEQILQLKRTLRNWRDCKIDTSTATSTIRTKVFGEATG